MRLFIGTLLSQDNLAYYAGAVGAWCAAHRQLKPIPPATAHLTIAFMPAVGDTDVPPLEGLLHDVAAAAAPIAITLEPPSVLWAGRAPRLVDVRVSDGSDAVMSLTGTLARELVRRMPAVDVRGAKSAHVTLARFSRTSTTDEGRQVEQSLSGERREDKLDSLALIHSQLTSAGPIYSVLMSWPLGGPT